MIISILTDSNVITIFGSILSAMGAIAIGLMLYIWNERKRMLIREKEEQQNFNFKMEHELKHVGNGLIKVESTMDNLTGWLKSVQNESRQTRSDLQEVEKDMAQMKGKCK